MNKLLLFWGVSYCSFQSETINSCFQSEMIYFLLSKKNLILRDCATLLRQRQSHCLKSTPPIKPCRRPLPAARLYRGLFQSRAAAALKRGARGNSGGIAARIAFCLPRRKGDSRFCGFIWKYPPPIEAFCLNWRRGGRQSKGGDVLQNWSFAKLTICYLQDYTSLLKRAA